MWAHPGKPTSVHPYALRLASKAGPSAMRAERYRFDFRPSEGKAQAVRLPFLWEQGNVNRATLLINRAAKALLEGSTDSLTAAIAIAQGNSTTMCIGVNWEEVAEGLRDVLMNHRNEILAKT